MEIIKLDYVFNPRSNTYEVVYKVISRLENGNTQTFYTYAVYKVPVWELDQNGNRVRIIGYKYYYKIIPELIAIVLDPINGHLKMQFE